MKEDSKLTQLVKELEQAKENARACLDSGYTLVHCHSLTYWASRVDSLRESIKELM